MDIGVSQCAAFGAIGRQVRQKSLNRSGTLAASRARGLPKAKDRGYRSPVSRYQLGGDDERDRDARHLSQPHQPVNAALPRVLCVHRISPDSLSGESFHGVGHRKVNAARSNHGIVGERCAERSGLAVPLRSRGRSAPDQRITICRAAGAISNFSIARRIAASASAACTVGEGPVWRPSRGIWAAGGLAIMYRERGCAILAFSPPT